MKRAALLAGAALALTSAWAIAQDAPESLLPPGFDNPAPQPAPAAAAPAAASATSPRSAPSTGSSGASPAAGIAGSSEITSVSAEVSQAASAAVSRLTLEELEKLSPEQIQEALDIKPKYDIPGNARRALRQIGVLGMEEGGMPSFELAGQNASLVKAILAGNNGAMVSRWGHILLRRALASRLDAPAGMQPADFAALRTALLVRMGEGEAARALAQDIDTGNYTASLSAAAFDAYVATADFTGICPMVMTSKDKEGEPRWDAARQMCRAFRGEGNNALKELDRELSKKSMARIDVLLAQKYAGAAGKARRAVTIEWDGVTDLTPWRYALTLAVGLEPPEPLMTKAGTRFESMAASAPMLGLARRAAASDSAGASGVLSSSAMVDLYSQIYSDSGVNGPAADRADLLHTAYVGGTVQSRVDAMQSLWTGATTPQQRHAREVMTAHAAARVPSSENFGDHADALIASMLAAGLDRNALRWAEVADEGSLGWALLTLAGAGANQLDAGSVNDFFSEDDSEESRKSAFFVAGLAGLGRISPETATDLADDLDIDLKRQTRWSNLIVRAAQVDNQVLVALLAGVGMQGRDWSKMTPRHLFHIVSALNRVGLSAEARMIAAEAVARG